MSRRHWIDIDSGTAPDVINTDVCIIGAGAAGSYLAAELGHRGLDVVVLDSGGASAASSELAGFDPIFGNAIYPGALVGRYFGMGGSTSRWGGALVPHTLHDLRAEGTTNSAWEAVVQRVSTHASSVLLKLGYKRTPDFEGYPRKVLPLSTEELAQAGIDVHANLTIPFGRKNLSFLWGDISQTQRVKLFLNATAKNWILKKVQDELLVVTGLKAVSRNGGGINVAARRYIVASGAIESARILMEIDREAGQGLFKKESMPGRFLVDHISLPIAEVLCEDRAKVIESFAPRFVNGWMRSFRFLLRSASSDVPRGFGHFIFEQESIGFKVAKETLSAVQARRLPVLSMSELAFGARGLAALTYNRFFKSRLYVPADTSVRLQLDIEQQPSEKNSISLTDEIDAYGRPRARIDWSIRDDDIRSMCKMADRLLSRWPDRSGCLPRLLALPIAEVACKPYDAYHPAGTCRMGEGDDGVVDFELKVRGLSNVWVVSTGVLPTAGSANPTFSMLCLARELACNFRSCA